LHQAHMLMKCVIMVPASGIRNN